MPPWNYALNRLQVGRAATGGCLYGGQSTTFWAPVRDLLHITNGPIGCGVYAHGNRPQVDGISGAEVFSGINLSTDFQEKDVVFGGANKLARAVVEADGLFPRNRGMTLPSTCPIALIGDDIESVAKHTSRELRKPVIPVQCAGFRRGDGIGETHNTIIGTWREWAAQDVEPGPRDVVLLCREMNGAWRNIERLLVDLGLRVVARWPGGSDRSQVAGLGSGRLVVSVDMEYWVRKLEQQFGLPSIEVSFLGPTATRESLRAIAACFDNEVACKAERMIADHSSDVKASLTASRRRLDGKLYFSFAPLHPRDVRVFGIRVGSALQGWPDREGRWHIPETPRRYQEMTPVEVDGLLRKVQPDLIDGLGQDAAGFRTAGYSIMDDCGRDELNRAAIGFPGIDRLARELIRLFDSPTGRLVLCPWIEQRGR
jgi:nitrogenase molybdenum-iron protein alpha chain